MTPESAISEAVLLLELASAMMRKKASESMPEHQHLAADLLAKAVTVDTQRKNLLALDGLSSNLRAIYNHQLQARG